MKLSIWALALLFAQQAPHQVAKNNPNGVWGAVTGTKFEIQLTGSALHVKMVPGSNPKFREYELEMKNETEANTYSGTGFFLAKMETGKECKLATEWRFVVVSNERIIGSASNVSADGNTCEVKSSEQVQLDLKKLDLKK